ncbi:hypothetical protein [Streptomyces mirabilis]
MTSFSSHSRTVIAFQTAVTLMLPERAGELARYRHLLEGLLRGARPA